MRIGRTTFRNIGIYIIVCFIIMLTIVFFSKSNLAVQSLMWIIASATIIEMMFFLVISTKIDGSILNFANMFILILWLFNFGQVFLVGIGATENLTIYLDYFNANQNYEAFKYIEFVFCMISIGILLGQAVNKQKKIEKKIFIKKTESLNSMQKKAKILIFLTFPVKVAIDIPTLVIGLTQGFGAANVWQGNIPDIIVTYGTISIIGIGLWIVSLSEDKRKQLLVFVVFISYIVIMMMGGKRSENVAYICILFLLFIKSRNIKIDFKKILFYGVLLYLLLTILNTIVYARTYVVDRNAKTLMETFIKCLTTRNMFITACRDYGTTGYTAECVIIYWLTNHSPAYGLSYLGGLASVFPNIGDIFGRINRSTGFAFLLQQNNALDSRYINIGGSMVGELFFNFGILGAIVGAFFVGLIIGTISKNVSIYLNGKIDYRVTYYIALMSALTYWIRDYFGGISREIVWSFIVCWIIDKVVVMERGIKCK